MTSPGLAAAWGLSVLPLVVETLSGGDLAVVGASRLGLVALPWLALAGLPGGAGARSVAAAVVPAALALPPLALGAGLDAGGEGMSVVAARVAFVLALIALWSSAAELARRRGRCVAYGATWFGLVPASAALHAALVWAPLGASATADGTWERLAAVNPLLWTADWTAAGEPAGMGLFGGLLSLAAAACACAVARGLHPPRGETTEKPA